MTPLHARVLRTIRRESLISDHGRVLVALSGGADSVGLSCLMRELAPRSGFVLAGVVHLNHQLREAAAADEHFCRELADAWSLPIEVARSDVRGRAARDRISIEEAGHRERYDFFERARVSLEADCIATAHTRDDQAETVLMRLVRGAGTGGLSGIHPRSGHVIRPALDVARDELRTYLAARGQTFREDETNQDLRVTRNWIRHELIPRLERRFSPAVVEVLARDATIARHDAAWLEAEANRVESGIVIYREAGVASFRVDDLADQPLALARRIAKNVLESVGGTTAGLAQVDRLVDIVLDDRRRVSVDFPGCRVSRDGDRIVAGPPRERRIAPAAGFEYALAIPGAVEVPEAGLVISARRLSPETLPEGPISAAGQVYVNADRLTEPLVVRSWRPGDRLKPMGLGGRKKVQDVFVDRKVARSTRQAVPIVADARQGIIWVVGHTMAEDFRVAPGTEGVLILKAVKLGGAG